MRLLVLTTSFPSNAYPLSGIFVQRMLDHLPDDIQITVLTPSTDQPPALVMDSNRIGIKPFRYAPRTLQTLAHRPGGIPGALKSTPWQWSLVPVFGQAMLLATLIQAYRADLIHAHWSVCGLAAGLAGRMAGRPVITTLRGSDVALAKESFLFRQAIKWCAAMSQRMVTVSQDMADLVTQWIPSAQFKIEVIPNGVGEMFNSVAPKAADQGFTVGVIGNLISIKKVDTVVRAFAMFAEHAPKARLRIVGDGPEKASIERLTRRLGIGGQVVFTGSLAPEQVPGQLAQCNAMVLASSSEGRPNVVLEAMAAGVSVVATDIGGVREMIVHQERGLLFQVGDERQLAVHLQALLDDPALGRRLAANAKQWIVEQGLTWDNTAKRYVDLYRHVIAEYAGRRNR